MKAKGYLFFSFILGAVVVVTSLVAVLITVLSVPSTPRYPVYSYYEYIDRTSSMLFNVSAGAQLYESEKAELLNGAEQVFNAIASGGKTVGKIKKNSTVKYSIIFDEKCSAQLKLSVCYRSSINRDTTVQNLFSVCLNGVELPTRRANIVHGYSYFDFQENLLCAVDFSAGRNTIEFIAETGDYELDYILIVPMAQRTSNETTIGRTTYAFNSEGRAQRFEAERAENEGSYAEYNIYSSSHYYIVSEEETASNTFWIESDKNVQTELAVALKNYGNTDTMSEFCEVYVNNEKLTVDAIIPIENIDGKFSQSSLGAINLREGINEIVFVNKNGAYQLDYIALNADINYTKESVAMRYEAENGVLEGGCITKKDTQASAENIVDNNVLHSQISYAVRSCVDDTSYLSVCLKYGGSTTVLSNLMEITINGKVIDIANKNIYQSSGYAEIYIGGVAIQKGENVFVIKSLSGNYQLDYFSLSNMEYVPSNGLQRYEAENALLTKGSQVEWHKTASGSKITGCNVQGSSINFSILCKESSSAILSFSMSSVAKNVFSMSDSFFVLVNGQTIDVSGQDIVMTEDWSIFMENTVGKINLQEGMNIISIVSKAERYTLDYISLSPTV